MRKKQHQDLNATTSSTPIAPDAFAEGLDALLRNDAAGFANIGGAERNHAHTTSHYYLRRRAMQIPVYCVQLLNLPRRKILNVHATAN